MRRGSLYMVLLRELRGMNSEVLSGEVSTASSVAVCSAVGCVLVRESIGRSQLSILMTFVEGVGWVEVEVECRGNLS